MRNFLIILIGLALLLVLVPNASAINVLYGTPLPANNTNITGAITLNTSLTGTCADSNITATWYYFNHTKKWVFMAMNDTPVNRTSACEFTSQWSTTNSTSSPVNQNNTYFIINTTVYNSTEATSTDTEENITGCSVDNTDPTVAGFISTTPSNDTNLSLNNWYVNISFTDIPANNFGNCTIEVVNGSGTINYTAYTKHNETSCGFNLTGQGQRRRIEFIVYVRDAVDRLDSTAGRVVTSDTTSPIVTYSTPANNTNWTTTNLNVENFTVTVSDNIFLEGISCSLWLNGTINVSNVSIGNNTNVVAIRNTSHMYAALTDSDETVVWNFSCNDSSGNDNTAGAEWFLNRDDSIPDYTSIATRNLVDTSVDICWHINEAANRSIASLNTTANIVSGNLSTIQAIGTEFCVTIRSLSESTSYNVTTHSCDQAGNCNLSASEGGPSLYFTTVASTAVPGGGGGGGGPSGYCGDGSCQPSLGENSNNCPGDCPPAVTAPEPAETKPPFELPELPFGIPQWGWAIIIVFIIIIIVIVIRRFPF